MALNLNGLFTFSDPEPTAGELAFDFITGAVALVLALEANLVTATAGVALASATADAAGIVTAPAPPSGGDDGWSSARYRAPVKFTPQKGPVLTIPKKKKKPVDDEEDLLVELGVL